MVIAGLVLAAIAALVHVFIFYLESIAWTSARARATFGTGTVEQASAQKELAFNQGFYNLFLAIGVVIGPAAAKPLALDIPLFVTDMSFGALSQEEYLLPAALTFVTAAAGISFWGIGGAFWALVVGLVAHTVLRRRDESGAGSATRD